MKGKKWSAIAKQLNNTRTEHMVKNRYKSIIHKNRPKTKKIAEKKLSENILIFLEEKLKELELNSLKKKLVNGK